MIGLNGTEFTFTATAAVSPNRLISLGTPLAGTNNTGMRGAHSTGANNVNAPDAWVVNAVASGSSGTAYALRGNKFATIEAAGAIDASSGPVLVYGDSAGRIGTTNTNALIGKALTSAAAAGDMVLVSLLSA